MRTRLVMASLFLAGAIAPSSTAAGDASGQPASPRQATASQAPAPTTGTSRTGDGSDRGQDTAVRSDAKVTRQAPQRTPDVVDPPAALPRRPRAQASSVDAAREAIQRAIAGMSSSGAREGHAPAATATSVPVAKTGAVAPRRSPSAGRTAARSRAASHGLPSSGVTLRWPPLPHGARTLIWEPEHNGRPSRDGVRLVWAPAPP